MKRVAVGATVREGVDIEPTPSLTVAPTATRCQSEHEPRSEMSAITNEPSDKE